MSGIDLGAFNIDFELINLKKLENLLKDLINDVNLLMDRVDGMIESAARELRAIIDEIRAQVDTMVDNIMEAYRYNLEVTLSSVDTLTRNKILEVIGAMGQVADELESTIEVGEEKLNSILRNANTVLRTSIDDLREVTRESLFYLGETGDFLVDKTVNGLLTILSIVLLGVGVLILIVQFLKNGIPDGAGGWILISASFLFAVVFGLVGFVPKVRMRLMTFVGVGIKERVPMKQGEPKIYQVEPHPYIFGETDELTVSGTQMIQNGQPPQAAKLGDTELQIRASSMEKIVLAVGNLQLPTGSVGLELIYAEGVVARYIVSIDKVVEEEKPDLRIQEVTFPNSMEARKSVLVDIKVANNGKGDAKKSFIVKWKPKDGHAGIDYQIPELKAAETTNFQLEHTDPGNMTSTVQVDTLNRIHELDEGNNFFTSHVKVGPPSNSVLFKKLFEVSNNFSDLDTGIDLPDGKNLIRFNFIEFTDVEGKQVNGDGFPWNTVAHPLYGGPAGNPYGIMLRVGTDEHVPAGASVGYNVFRGLVKNGYANNDIENIRNRQYFTKFSRLYLRINSTRSTELKGHDGGKLPLFTLKGEVEVVHL